MSRPLRFSTMGSVDDGKSTLIGRLLYDSRSVYDDQIAAVSASKWQRAAGTLDFALLTDGLRAEREQGITIDVAYRYFSTPRRKFILADTPGHEQYTRNMATGASTADAAVLVLDAARGVLPQSRRHAAIAQLLRVPHIAVAVSKMDQVAFDAARFAAVATEIRALAEDLGLPEPAVIPVSGLEGDNVVARSPRSPWYDGPSLLDWLESRESPRPSNRGWRLPVQCVLRPDAAFRGFAGQLAGGTLRRGTAAIALPSGERVAVCGLFRGGNPVELAQPGESVVVTTDREVDLSRGDLLASANHVPQAATRFRAHMVWMDAQPARPGAAYLLKHTTRCVRARLETVVGARQMDLNEIGATRWATHQPLFFEPYRRDRAMGAFIVIDLVHHGTVAAGMIEEATEEEWDDPA